MIIKKFETKEDWLKLRLGVITSTEVSALFGMNPYTTKFELYHQKKNEETVILEDNDRMKWGRRLEQPIAEGVAEDQGWTVEAFKDFGVMEDLRAGSSFDYKITAPEAGLLEIKNVDFIQIKNKWIIEDGLVIEAPAHIELQVQHQLMVTGLSVCYIAALEGGNKVHLIKRTPQPQIIQAIKDKITKFWQDVEQGNEPKPNWERDADFIAKLNNFAEPGKVMDVTPARLDELALEYGEVSKQASEMEKKKKALKAEMLTLIGESEKVIGENYTISAGVVGETEVSFTRKAYRNFRVYRKGEKK